MTVTQFVEHLCADDEEFFLSHLVAHHWRIAGIDVVPVDIFLAEEAVVLVDCAPQGVEVAAWIIGILGYFVASSGDDESQQREYEVDEAFHVSRVRI